MKLYEISFSVRNPDGSQDTNLDYLKTTVTAMNGNQAEAMIESQYNGRAQIWSCIPIN